MDFNKRKIKIKEVAKTIIAHQYDDQKEYSIDNHFLSDVINEIVQLQADKIKGFFDFIIDFSKTNNVREFDDMHSIFCKILKCTDEADVLSIHDETIYGPNLQHIIVIDDKKNGKFHIRKMFKESDSKIYMKNNYQVDDNFTSTGFILTYHYQTDFMRNMLAIDSIQSDALKKQLEGLKKIEDMGDNTFHLYECVAYSASLLGSVIRDIKTNK